jgi:hypothetical protein
LDEYIQQNAGYWARQVGGKAHLIPILSKTGLDSRRNLRAGGAKSKLPSGEGFATATKNSKLNIDPRLQG